MWKIRKCQQIKKNCSNRFYNCPKDSISDKSCSQWILTNMSTAGFNVDN